MEYLQDVNPHPPARGMTLSYSLEFERGEAYEEFAIRMDGNVPHLITYQFFPGKRFECYPIGGCSVVDVPKNCPSINPQRRIGAAAGLRNRLTEFFDVPAINSRRRACLRRAADHKG